jgi:hypothetical protein
LLLSQDPSTPLRFAQDDMLFPAFCVHFFERIPLTKFNSERKILTHPFESHPAGGREKEEEQQ